VDKFQKLNMFRSQSICNQ